MSVSSVSVTLSFVVAGLEVVELVDPVHVADTEGLTGWVQMLVCVCQSHTSSASVRCQ